MKKSLAYMIKKIKEDGISKGRALSQAEEKVLSLKKY